MPDLPTLNVTAAQAQRITAVFGSTLEYRKWLRQRLIEYVIQQETFATQIQNREALEAEIPIPTT